MNARHFTALREHGPGQRLGGNSATPRRPGRQVCANHAEDVRLSTVSRVTRALGKAVRIELVEAAEVA